MDYNNSYDIEETTLTVYVIKCKKCKFFRYGCTNEQLKSEHSAYHKIFLKQESSWCCICEKIRINNHLCLSHIASRDWLDVIKELK